jgi:hypothetical protein
MRDLIALLSIRFIPLLPTSQAKVGRYVRVACHIGDNHRRQPVSGRSSRRTNSPEKERKILAQIKIIFDRWRPLSEAASVITGESKEPAKQ